MVRPRNWGISNLFSESHRKFLPGNFCLWDIDGFFIDDNDNIIGVYEGKNKMISKDKGHFIKTFYDPKNLQAGFIRHLSRYIPVWVSEESTRKWWRVDDGFLSESKDPDIHLIKTEDKIYVEDILKKTINLHNPVGVFLRTEGKKNCPNTVYADFIAEKLGIKKILINDVLDQNLVHFKSNEKIVSCSILDDNWLNEWKDLEII